jgi:hypothetical protein
MTTLPRVLAGVAGAILVATAMLHGSGTASVSESIAGTAASPFVQRMVPGLWLFFSWHLIALGCGMLAAAWRGGAAMRALVWFAAVVVLVDTLWVLRLAGLFAGTALLALATLCLVGAAARWPGE